MPEAERWRVALVPQLRGLGEWRCWVSPTRYILEKLSRAGFHLGAVVVSWKSVPRECRVDQFWDAVESFKMKRRPKGQNAPRPPHAEYADLLESYPTLAGWLTDATFEDGEARNGGWFCISARNGSWHATMKDSSEAASINLAAPTWTLLLSLMEHALTDPAAQWRHDSQAAGPKTGKKK